MLNKLKSYRWICLVLVVALACLIVPVAESIGSEDLDCCSAAECLDSFCICNHYVVELPVQTDFISALRPEFTLYTDISQYSLVLVPYIFRPPAA